MKIVEIGTFDNHGMPTYWTMNGSDQKEGEKYCLGIDQLFPGSVDVNGVEIVEWTKKRKRQIKGGNL